MHTIKQRLKQRLMLHSLVRATGPPTSCYTATKRAVSCNNQGTFREHSGVGAPGEGRRVRHEHRGPAAQRAHHHRARHLRFCCGGDGVYDDGGGFQEDVVIFVRE
eukprot:5231419-Pyramimonas_sp.AAC.1